MARVLGSEQQNQCAWLPIQSGPKPWAKMFSITVTGKQKQRREPPHNHGLRITIGSNLGKQAATARSSGALAFNPPKNIKGPDR